MEGLVRSKERQQRHGEVFTPDFLVERMLNLVSDDVWNDPTKTFLEPSCGNGNFILAIIQRKIDHGSTIEQALSTTFGVDIMEDNIAECHQRIYNEFLSWMDNRDELMQIVKQNIYRGDFLNPDPDQTAL
jgi:hypothetical protein